MIPPEHPPRGSARVNRGPEHGRATPPNVGGVEGARASARVPVSGPAPNSGQPNMPRRRLPEGLGSAGGQTGRDEFDRDPRRLGAGNNVRSRNSGDDRRPAGQGKTGYGSKKGNVPLGKDGLPLTADQQKKLRRKRRRRKIYLISFLLVLVLMFAGMGAAYAAIQVPLPNPEATNQISTIYYSDGKTQLARIGIENREEVKIDDIPKHVQQAVVTAEDRSFWENDGVSISGTLRALWANITGGSRQGGSTITQQYIKNAYLTHEQTYSRKFKEMVLAIKIDREYSKEQIMEFYLNTIFWGRSTYGIQAAAKAYFGKTVDQLSVSEAALLAGIIKAPNSYDPETNRAQAKERWDYVINGMAKAGWLPKDEAATLEMPQVIPQEESYKDNGQAGVSGTILSRVQRELAAQGISEKELLTAGYQITTTIDPQMQKALESAVDKNMNGQPENLATAVAAVEPLTGKVKAYYGGKNGYAGYDLAGPLAPHPAGSSFKPFVLGKALEEDISVESVWDGSSPQNFSDRPGRPLRNSENDNSCRICTLDQSTVKSLNTVYWALTREVGAKNVAEFAERAGIMTLDSKKVSEIKDEINNGIGIGQYSVSVLEQANAYATIAGGGQYAKSHFVENVKKLGQEHYVSSLNIKKAFERDVALNMSYVMQHVVEAGKNRLAGGRAAAGKTGTQQYQDTEQNAHAWMCGYTMEVAVAVWVGNKGQDGPIQDKAERIIYGSGLPGSIWKTFLDEALKGKKKQAFPKAKLIGDESKGNVEPAPPADTTPTTPALPSQRTHPSASPSTTPSDSSPTQPTDPAEFPSATSTGPGNGGPRQSQRPGLTE